MRIKEKVMRWHIHAHIIACTHERTRTHAHAHTHTQIHTHTHTHTHTCVFKETTPVHHFFVEIHILVESHFFLCIKSPRHLTFSWNFIFLFLFTNLLTCHELCSLSHPIRQPLSFSSPIHRQVQRVASTQLGVQQPQHTTRHCNTLWYRLPYGWSTATHCNTCIHECTTQHSAAAPFFFLCSVFSLEFVPKTFERHLGGKSDIHMYICIYMCVYIFEHAHVCKYVYKYIYIYSYVCIYMCICK